MFNRFFFFHQQDHPLPLLVGEHQSTAGDAAFDRFAPPVGGI
jgi:hypothetical protein